MLLLGEDGGEGVLVPGEDGSGGVLVPGEGVEDGVLGPGDAGRSGLTSNSCMAALSGFIKTKILYAAVNSTCVVICTQNFGCLGPAILLATDH